MNYRHGHCCKTSKGNHSRIYLVWHAMRNRCYNPKNEAYARYGGRGITICDRWLGKQGFGNFLSDMGDQPDLQLERIDNNQGYSKENCRWVTRVQQCNNRRDNHFITVNGERLTISQAERKLGWNRGTIRDRLNLGWNEQRAVTQPPKFLPNTKRSKEREAYISNC